LELLSELNKLVTAKLIMHTQRTSSFCRSEF